MSKLTEFNKDFSILVATSDSYISLMEGFIYFLGKNWPMNPLDVFVSFESKKYDNLGNATSVICQSSDWSKRIFKTLEQIKTKYIIFLLDDYWSFEKVNEDVLFEVFRFTKNNDVDYITFLNERSSINYFHKLVNVYEANNIFFYQKFKGKKSDYFIGAGGIYKVEFLKKVLRKRETAWTFESNASYRYLKFKETKCYIYSLNQDPMGYLYGGVIHKGKVRPEANKYLEEFGFNLSWENKKVQVSTLETPIFIRAIRKLLRPFKKYLSVYFWKF
jgi:hypothetical protein